MFPAWAPIWMVIIFIELEPRRKSRFGVWRVQEDFSVVSDKQEGDENEGKNMGINSI